MYLRTLGHPALQGEDGNPVRTLRKKDLALLVYLGVEGTAVHSRSRLAALLWGESPEEAARHSLTQALGRLSRLLPPGSLVIDNRAVGWGGTVPCDAVQLRGGMDPAAVDDDFSLYGGDFLRGFSAGPGAEEFAEWADGQQAPLRSAALRLLEQAGEEAAARGEWHRAVRLAERAVEIDPIAEKARRRLMRALAASGERNRALRHYEAFAEWLEREFGGEPDPETRALADQLRAEAADPPAPPRPFREAPAPPPPDTASPVDGGPAPPPAYEWRSGADASGAAARANRLVRASTPGGDRSARRRGWKSGAVAMAVVVGLGVLLSSLPSAGDQPPAQGETVRVRGDDRTYLAFAGTLYVYPDSATLRACTGRQPHAVRELRGLPDWPRVTLPSVREHPWIGGPLPVVSDSADGTVFVSAGCVLAAVPLGARATLDSIFGPGALERRVVVAYPVLQRMPRSAVAGGYPVRPAGTLIRAPDGPIRWITHHGGALAVGDSAVLATYCRAPRQAVAVGEDEFRYYRPSGTLLPAPSGCRGHG